MCDYDICYWFSRNHNRLCKMATAFNNFEVTIMMSYQLTKLLRTQLPLTSVRLSLPAQFIYLKIEIELTAQDFDGGLISSSAIRTLN